MESFITIKFTLLYIIVAIVWSSFQGYRGIIEQNRAYKDRPEKSPTWSINEKCIILFIHDFAFRFICTISGFAALYLIYITYGNLTLLRDLTSGLAILMVFLSIIGLIGIGGQLHHIIIGNKWPKL